MLVVKVFEQARKAGQEIDDSSDERNPPAAPQPRASLI